MTNAEKYKTVEERSEKFGEFCASNIRCGSCPAHRGTTTEKWKCSFSWLELNAEDSKEN